MIRRFLVLVFILALIPGSASLAKSAQTKKARAATVTKQTVVKASPRKANRTEGSNVPILGLRSDISAVKTRAGANSGKEAVSSAHKPASNQSALRDRALPLSSKSAIIIDVESGDVLYALNPDQPRQPASTIKVITGLIAIHSLENEDPVHVSRRASGMPNSKINLSPSQTYRADDMINAVLLSSANDASVAVAETIAGSEEKFAKLMTHRANLWGATNTVCQTANGLTAEGQHSTARDLATIFTHAMKNEEFARRMRSHSATTSYGKKLRNHNKALWQMRGAMGGKTGFTNAAGQTYVGQFTRDGQTITVALMGSRTMWNDLRNLVEYGFDAKERIQLAETVSTASAKTVN